MLTKLLNKKLTEYCGFEVWRVLVFPEGYVRIQVPAMEMDGSVSGYDIKEDDWYSWRFWDRYEDFETWLCGDE